MASLSAAPLWILLVQVPEASFDLFERLLAPWSEMHPWVGNGFLLFLLWLGTTFSSSLTFLGIKSITQGQRPDLNAALSVLAARAKPLATATSLVVVAVFLGILLILPGIYFMAIYLFVPFLVLEGESTSGSIYLVRSKKLAKQDLTLSLMVASIFFVSSVLFLMIEHLPLISSLGTSTRIAVRFVLSIAIGALLNGGLSHLYLELQERSAS